MQRVLFNAAPIPFGKRNLLSEANWKATAKECEGIHPDAPLVPFESIKKFLEDQRTQGPEEHFVNDSSGSD